MESAGECLRDLLDLSAQLLRAGGRLVYFLPAAPEIYSEAEVPGHPALALVANCEQVLNARYSRRLITMRKARHMRVPSLIRQTPHIYLESPAVLCVGSNCAALSLNKKCTVHQIM